MSVDVPAWVIPLIEFSAWLAKEIAELLKDPSEEKARALRAEAKKRIDLAASEVQAALAKINAAFPE